MSNIKLIERRVNICKGCDVLVEKRISHGIRYYFSGGGGTIPEFPESEKEYVPPCSIDKWDECPGPFIIQRRREYYFGGYENEKKDES